MKIIFNEELDRMVQMIRSEDASTRNLVATLLTTRRIFYVSKAFRRAAFILIYAIIPKVYSMLGPHDKYDTLFIITFTLGLLVYLFLIARNEHRNN